MLGGQDKWRIRKATKSDASNVVSFLEKQRRPKRSDFAISDYFIAECSGNIVGCIALRNKEKLGYLYGLAVDRQWRRRGIGHALTQHGLDCLRKKGARSAFTLVMFWNIRFVKHHGFRVIDKRSLRLVNLHQDFVDKWCARSVLLVADLRQPKS